MKKADLILTSDWHIRETIPVCRTDDFWEAQWEKVHFVKELHQEHNCPVLHAGDLFHHWKPSPHLLSSTIEALPYEFNTIYGQHDLPQHNWDNRFKSGIHTLAQARALSAFKFLHYPKKGLHITGASWGQPPEEIPIEVPDDEAKRKILVWHKMVWQGKRLWPGQTDPNATAILKKYPEYDLILTGDNHKPFVEKYDGRLLVNPGSLTRQTAAQVDHLPRVYLYYAADNTVRSVFLPIQSGEETISRDHIDRNEERSERISAFITKLGGDWDVTLSFEANLEQFLQSNKVLASVKKIIYAAMDHDTSE